MGKQMSAFVNPLKPMLYKGLQGIKCKNTYEGAHIIALKHLSVCEGAHLLWFSAHVAQLCTTSSYRQTPP